MKKFTSRIRCNHIILALGAESAGNFSLFRNGGIYLSEDFGDLLDENNFSKYKKELSSTLKENEIIPDIILTDLHPDYKTTHLGEELAEKFGAKHITAQHHIAHIFSQIGKEIMQDPGYELPSELYGITLDGTGFGSDENIWGGEVFKIKNGSVERIGHLENQTLIGADLAIHEPARMLVSILSKFSKKEEVYQHVKKYYTKNQFELLWNQLQQNFNCQETSSTGRVFDAVSILLGFAKNERKSKHEATYLLEKNSTSSYQNLKPKIKDTVLQTTPLFQYLMKNISKDRKRLAATAQLYIAQGLSEIVGNKKDSPIYVSGGLANNKIILTYFKSMGFVRNKKSCIARGDAGLSFGQIIYRLLTDPRD